MERLVFGFLPHDDASARQLCGRQQDHGFFLDKYPVGSPEWRWLEGYGDMKESSELSSLSEDSLKRNHPDKIVRLGPRRLGMKRRMALSLGTPLKTG